ncbi:MAG: cytochrome P450 [Pseudomonadota bacterium]
MTESSAEIRRPPGPDGPVSLGIDRATLETLSSLQAEHGNMLSLEQPNGRLAYFVNEPHEVRRILVRRHPKYRKGPGFERVKMLLGNGLIVSDGEVWRRSRTMIQPAFKVQNVHRLMQTMVLCADERARHWAEVSERGGTLNMSEEANEFALALILRCIFGRDYERRGMRDDNPFEFLSRDSARDLSVVLKVRELRKLLLEIIAERRASKLDGQFDFLEMYLGAHDKNREPFSDRELLDEIMTLIVAGFETSANTLSWVWYLLAGHPAVEARLIEEANRCLPNVDAVGPEAVQGMLYTQQVLEEALRLYPPVWLFTRRAHEFDELDDYDVPAGSDIYLSPYLMHRTPSFWPDPERFDPDRFERRDSAGRKQEQPFFPFSLGPRRCLGEYFSFLEMKLHLGFLLPRFRMQRVSRREPELELAINLRSSEDIRLHVSKRTD